MIASEELLDYIIKALVTGFFISVTGRLENESYTLNKNGNYFKLEFTIVSDNRCISGNIPIDNEGMCRLVTNILYNDKFLFFEFLKPDDDSEKPKGIIKENIDFKTDVSYTHSANEGVLCSCNACYSNTSGYSYQIIEKSDNKQTFSSYIGYYFNLVWNKVLYLFDY